MPRRVRKARVTEAASGSRKGPEIPLNSPDEKSMIILRMAERSGERSMEVVSKRIQRGIRAALKANASNGVTVER